MRSARFFLFLFSKDRIMDEKRPYQILNGHRYDWRESYGDYIWAFTTKNGVHVVKRWREEIDKLDPQGAARSVAEDVKRREAESRKRRKTEKRRPLELMRSDEYDIARAMNDPSVINHEKLKSSEELNESFDERERLEYTDGYEEAWSCWGARQFLTEQFHMKTDKSYYKLPLSVANHLNCELIRFRNVFGTVGFIDRVVVDSDDFPAGAAGAYDPNTNTILLRSDYREPPTNRNRPKTSPEGFPIAYTRSTGSSRHMYRHEIAHALYYFIVQRVDSSAEERADELHQRFFKSDDGGTPDGCILLSEYAQKSKQEMFAEAVAQLMDNGSQSSFARAVVNYVIYGKKSDVIE